MKQIFGNLDLTHKLIKQVYIIYKKRLYRKMLKYEAIYFNL